MNMNTSYIYLKCPGFIDVSRAENPWHPLVYKQASVACKTAPDTLLGLYGWTFVMKVQYNDFT